MKIKTYKSKTLHPNLKGFETWSLILRKAYRLMAFENRILRGIFDPRKVEVTGAWRKLHFEELNNVYEGVSKSFRTQSITKYMHTFGISH
jgi:hypothetical protein